MRTTSKQAIFDKRILWIYKLLNYIFLDEVLKIINLIFVFVAVNIFCDSVDASASATKKKREHDDMAASVVADVDQIFLDSFLISLQEDFGSFKKNFKELLQLFTEMPVIKRGGCRQWQVWLAKEQSTSSKRRTTRASQKSGATKDEEIFLNFTVEEAPYESQFMAEDELYGLFESSKQRRTHYLLSLFEYHEGIEEQSLVAQLRIDSLGHVAELMSLSKGKLLAGREFFDIMQKLWTYLRIEHVLLCDTSELIFGVGDSQYKFATRIFLPIAEGLAIYEKLGGFKLLKHSNLRALDTFAPGGVLLSAQDPSDHQAAIERLARFPLVDLQKSFARNHDRSSALAILIEKYVKDVEAPNLRSLVANMASALRSGSKKSIADFSLLMDVVLKQRDQRSLLGRDLSILEDAYIWIVSRRS